AGQTRRSSTTVTGPEDSWAGTVHTITIRAASAAAWCASTSAPVAWPSWWPRWTPSSKPTAQPSVPPGRPSGPNWLPSTPRSVSCASTPTLWPERLSWPPAFTCTCAANGENDVSKTGTPAQSGPKGHDKLVALIDRAEKGDKTALPALQELLEDPALVDALGG